MKSKKSSSYFYWKCVFYGLSLLIRTAYLLGNFFSVLIPSKIFHLSSLLSSQASSRSPSQLFQSALAWQSAQTWVKEREFKEQLLISLMNKILCKQHNILKGSKFLHTQQIWLPCDNYSGLLWRVKRPLETQKYIIMCWKSALVYWQYLIQG